MRDLSWHEIGKYEMGHEVKTMFNNNTWKAIQAIKVEGKTDWLGIERAIKMVITDVAMDESLAIDGIRMISDIIGKGTGRGYVFGDVKRAIERNKDK